MQQNYGAQAEKKQAHTKKQKPINLRNLVHLVYNMKNNLHLCAKCTNCQEIPFSDDKIDTNIADN